MKKQILVVGLAMFAIGFASCGYVKSNSTSNIAVIDVNKVVSQSSQVMALKKEQNLKMEELQKWLEVAKADVDKQQTAEGKAKLVKKYDADYAKKQQAIQKDYTTKLQSIDKDITSVITKEAEEKGYEVVLAKGVVLYGGDDITNTIAKKIK
jgi:Skp family chaperone for outer membrane proteins